MSEELVIGLVSISDRASAGVYKDEGIPSLKEWLSSAIASPKWRDETRLIADEQPVIERTLQGLPEVPGIFAAVPYCIDLIGGPYIETHESVVKAFRPKSAIRKK